MDRFDLNVGLSYACRSSGAIGRPAGVLSHIGGEHFNDLRMVILRVPCDALQGVDAAETDIKLA